MGTQVRAAVNISAQASDAKSFAVSVVAAAVNHVDFDVVGDE